METPLYIVSVLIFIGIDFGTFRAQFNALIQVKCNIFC
jgi:hypothetical protein